MKHSRSAIAGILRCLVCGGVVDYNDLLNLVGDLFQYFANRIRFVKSGNDHFDQRCFQGCLFLVDQLHQINIIAQKYLLAVNSSF